jgi:Predicted transcriptional regulator
MSANFGFNSLYKALKDETRKRIILALNENGSLTYTDLMQMLNIDSTGRLNYHIKVLNELIVKKENGEYHLTEKGRLASQLLCEFPETNQNSQTKVRQFWITAGIAQVGFLLSVIALYYFNYVNSGGLIRGLIVAFFCMILTILLYRTKTVRVYSGSKTEHHALKIFYPMIGACLGGAIAFFSGVVMSGISIFITKHPFFTGAYVNWFLVVAFVIAPVIGGLSGYLVGRKNNFKKPNWATRYPNS